MGHEYSRRWLTLTILGLVLTLVVANITAVNLALPQIQDGLGSTNAELQWIAASYSLFFAGLMLPMGALGDHYGRRRALIVGLIIFTIAAVISSFAAAPSHIIVMRCLQGAATAMMMPATLSIITEIFPAKEQPRAFAIWTSFAGAGGIGGPIAAGLLLRWVWWGGVFMLVVPLAVICLAGTLLLVPRSKAAEQTFPFDPLGALLAVLTVGTLIYAVIEGPNSGWTSQRVLLLFAFAAAAAICFIMWESKRPHPIIDPAVYQDREFLIDSITMTAVFIGLLGWLFLLPQYFQLARGHSALDAAIRISPSSWVTLLLAPSAANLAARFGIKRLLTTGLFLSGTGLVGLAVITTSVNYWVIFGCFVIGSSGNAMIMPVVTQRIISCLPARQAGVGSAINEVNREIGAALGIAVVGSLLSVGYRQNLGSTVDNLEGTLRGNPELAGAVDFDLVSGAQDSLGKALDAADEIERAGGPIDLVESLRDRATEAFDAGMTLGLFVAAVVVLSTSVMVAVFYPKNRGVADDGETDGEVMEDGQTDVVEIDEEEADRGQTDAGKIDDGQTDATPASNLTPSQPAAPETQQPQHPRET